MYKSKLFILLLVVFASAKQFTQAEVQAKLVKDQLIGSNAQVTFFKNYNDKKYIVNYNDGNSEGKVVLVPDGKDGLKVIMNEKFISFSFTTKSIRRGGKHKKHFRKFNGMNIGKGKHHRMNKRKRCANMKKKLVKKLFAQLPIYEGATVENIEKLRFQKGKGIQFNIILKKDEKKYLVNAFFKPRKNQLMIGDIREIKTTNPLQNGLNLISNLVNKIAEGETQENIMLSKGLLEGKEKKMKNNLINKIGNLVQQNKVIVDSLIPMKEKVEKIRKNIVTDVDMKQKKTQKSDDKEEDIENINDKN